MIARRLKRPLPILTAIVLLAVLTVTLLMATQPERHVVSEREATPAAGATGVRPEVCDDDQLQCLELSDGQVVVVYPSTEADAELMLWDPGGPGTSLLDAVTVRQVLPAWTISYDVAVIAEPWTYRAVSDECRAEIAGIYSAVRAGFPANATASCDWDSLAPTSGEYANSLVLLEQELGSIGGVYATSFGAIRALPAIERSVRNGGFVVIESPAPPPSSSARDLLASRLSAMRAVITHVPKCAQAGCYVKRLEILQRVLNGKGQLGSLQATLAFMGMTYSVSDNAAFLDAFWRSGGRLTRVGITSMKQVALNFARVSASGVPRLDLIGYLAGICPTYDLWPGPDNPLFEMHAPCRSGFTSNGYQDYFDQLHTLRGRIALITNRDDPVVPYRFQVGWSAALAGERTYTVDRAGHAPTSQRIDQSIEAWLANR